MVKVFPDPTLGLKRRPSPITIFLLALSVPLFGQKKVGSSKFFVERRPKIDAEETAKEAWKCYDGEGEVMKSWM